jgi:uncharacterized membrane protein
MDTTSASSPWSTQGELQRRSLKYVKNIRNLFITIVLIIYIYIYRLVLLLELKIDWKKRKDLRSEQIKAIQEALSGFLLNQVIDSMGTYYYNPKELISRLLGLRKKSQGHE